MTDNLPYDGGSAFPFAVNAFSERFSRGMSLRTYIAVEAMKSMIANGLDASGTEAVVARSFLYADAMLRLAVQSKEA